MIEVKKFRDQGLKISSNSTKKPEDYAKRIKELNEYLGDLVFAEIQLIDPEKNVGGRENLLKLTEKYPRVPHAFIRLCIYDFETGHNNHALETIENFYTNYKEFHTIPELETCVILLYASMLFQEQHYIECFE